MHPDDYDIVPKGVKVVAKVSLRGVDNGDQIEVTFAPNVETLLPQVEKLFIQISIRARGLMLQKLADRFNESGLTGNIPKCLPQPIQAHATIFIACASVADINGNEVSFFPSAVAETEIFEWEKIKEAKMTLVMSLLRCFAELGGH